MVKLKIDGIDITAQEGATIMEAALENHIQIPSLCYLKDLNEIGACRICVVEIEGIDKLVPACNNAVSEGMVVRTNSPRVRRARRTNLQLILSQHDCHCATCARSGNCRLQTLANDLNISRQPYQTVLPVNRWDESFPLIREESKCIKCMRCVQVCEKIQSLGVWDVSGTGSRTTVNISHNRSISATDCAICGQCITHCPTGALHERQDVYRVFDAIADPEVTTVVQIAPAVRAAWGEEFGLDRDFATVERIAAALRRMGVDYVFDTNFTADLTIMEEGSEFIERFTHRGEYSWPMFTSCCPAWVRFVKSQYPEFTANLSTAKSPQQMFGAVAKSYFAQQKKIDPHKMFVISIMPCTSKKSEHAIPVMNDACGDPDVDVVLTTRELVRMIRSEYIDPADLPEAPLDTPLGTGTGAAVIFGASGGVMVAALRSAYYLITGQNPDPDAFVGQRSQNGWSEATIQVPGAGEVRVAVASGLATARKLLEALRRKEVAYDFVEIMACPGGCAGGGGQTIHMDGSKTGERGKSLWRQDKNAPIRFSHENPDVLRLYEQFLGKPLGHLSHHLLHTDHFAWEMPPAPPREESDWPEE